jgi:hypothetical protein
VTFDDGLDGHYIYIYIGCRYSSPRMMNSLVHHLNQPPMGPTEASTQPIDPHPASPMRAGPPIHSSPSPRAHTRAPARRAHIAPPACLRAPPQWPHASSRASPARPRAPALYACAYLVAW